jgi:hypothetical protein
MSPVTIVLRYEGFITFLMHIPHHTAPVIPLQNTPLWCKFLAA